MNRTNYRDWVTQEFTDGVKTIHFYCHKFWLPKGAKNVTVNVTSFAHKCHKLFTRVSLRNWQYCWSNRSGFVVRSRESTVVRTVLHWTWEKERAHLQSQSICETARGDRTLDMRESAHACKVRVCEKAQGDRTLDMRDICHYEVHETRTRWMSRQRWFSQFSQVWILMRFIWCWVLCKTLDCQKNSLLSHKKWLLSLTEFTNEYHRKVSWSIFREIAWGSHKSFALLYQSGSKDQMFEFSMF